MSDVIREFASELRSLGLDFILRFEERDPQYIAIHNLCRGLGRLDQVLALTVLNALVSYQLTGKGENHWNYFSKYFVKNKPGNDLCGDFTKYVLTSRYLIRFRESRVNRIRRVCDPLVRSLISNAEAYLVDLDKLWRLITRVLGVRGNEKTVVFAVKMAYYVGRACGLNIRVPMDIPIPVDFRVTVITICSGLLGAFTGDPRELASVWMSRRRDEIQGVWGEVSRASGIPPLNLDSLIWVLGGGLIDSSFNLERALSYVESLGVDSGRVRRLMELMASQCEPR
ncbi:N-glycosylase/DNA lyase [Vulcanisaeta thermophila]|uniref:N-glycosylase/DNA lyase n=1 Tax=Vulcanisaeta thermophila TaxID=867917 RepID=UPI0008531F72|nr:N-glycosylase/DNA lyase [Vulcanisaeta thermophila]